MRYLLAAIIVLRLTVSADARIVDYPTYEELVERSDLIVIVHSLGTEPPRAGDKIVPVDDKLGELRPVFTKFKVLATLKGDWDNEHLRLCHYEQNPDGPFVGNGASLVVFPQRENELIQQRSWMARVDNNFILFLKRNEAGQLTFVTGQYDAEPSIRQICNPLPPSKIPDP